MAGSSRSATASKTDVLRVLATIEGVGEREDDGGNAVFTVTKPGNSRQRSWDNTVIGRIVVSDSRLAVETNSTARADALRSRLETHLGGLVRHRLRSEANAAALLAEARVMPRRRETAAEPPAELAAMVRQFREQHLRDWVDEQVPALDGRTPREAADIPALRPKLEVLLKEMEQQEGRVPEGQRVDLSWLREALRFV